MEFDQLPGRREFIALDWCGYRMAVRGACAAAEDAGDWISRPASSVSLPSRGNYLTLS
jgi:hypothetical protein